jgi:hypothetical protein
MHDNYLEQGMFGDPQEKVIATHPCHMLWCYTLKPCQTKKARMVCNGVPGHGAITLAHTYANSLNPSSERVFWAVAAYLGLKVVGADVSNAFAEDPAPKTPLCLLYIDDAYREWWEHHLKYKQIPPHYHSITSFSCNTRPSSRIWKIMGKTY